VFHKTPPTEQETRILSVSDRLLFMAGGFIEGLGALLAFAMVFFVVLALWAGRI
jgi:hypothetical protein